jgi:hypothetical protein
MLCCYTSGSMEGPWQFVYTSITKNKCAISCTMTAMLLGNWNFFSSIKTYGTTIWLEVCCCLKHPCVLYNYYWSQKAKNKLELHQRDTKPTWKDSWKPKLWQFEQQNEESLNYNPKYKTSMPEPTLCMCNKLFNKQEGDLNNFLSTYLSRSQRSS